jgi:hypothetical protein
LISGQEQDDEIVELGEFKLALRTMRTAFALAMPWNLSILALEGFFFQSNFCHQDLQNVDRKAAILTKFTDYVIAQNSDRWRDAEPFLTAGELKQTWASFYGAQPQSALKNQGQKKQQAGGRQQGKPLDPRIGLGICFAWNQGQCSKPAGSCTTAKGRALKHVCDFAADPAKPTEVCGKDHIRKDFHK